MPLVRVNTEKPYDVVIERNALDRCGELIASVHAPCRAAVITETNVAPLYLARVRASLEKSGFSVCEHIFQAGEKSKNLSTFGELLSFMAQSSVTRSDLAVALGGGVTGDLTGFAAACYERGIPFVQIPTTLLAMVDASVGGKTAVDLPEGKNLAGAFHQPELVVCDSVCLDTLPPALIADGAAEMIKHALLADPGLLPRLTPEGLAESPEELIARNVEIKRSFVVGDERDSGRRQMLNLGHTTGHAVEGLSAYSISHGRAVAIGMAAAVRGGNRAGLGFVEPELLLSALDAFSLPAACPFSAEEVFDFALSDKKRRGDRISYVALKAPGEPVLVPMTTAEFADFLKLALAEG